MKKRYLFLLSIYILLFVCYLYFSVNETEKLNEKIKDYEYVGDFHEDRAVVIKDGKIGFIDKSGDLIIPMKWDIAENFKKSEYYLEKINFDNGRCLLSCVNGSESYLIDREGNELYTGNFIDITKLENAEIIQVNDTNGEVTYFVSEGKFEKIDLQEKDLPIVVENWNYKSSQYRRGKNFYFTLENLCNGKKAGWKELKKYGYEYAPALNCSNDGVGLLTLRDTSTKKYGIVDEKGNIIEPFKYDNRICMCYGILFEIVSFSRYTELGKESFPIYCNVYKDGQLLYEKLAFFNESKACMGFFVFKGNNIKDMYEKLDLSSDEFKIPESVEKTKFIDVDGNEVSRFPFGKNYLRYVSKNDWSDEWQLEDENGKLLHQQKFSIYSRFNNNLVIENSDGMGLVLSDTGDSIPAGYGGYLQAGIVNYTDKFINEFPLCDYNESLSESDNKLNCIHSKKVKRELREKKYITRYEVLNQDGTTLLPYDVDEVYNFSDGLLRLKLDGHYYFVDEDGKGLKIKK